MPYVGIKVAGTLTREQKAKIVEEITDTLERISKKPKSYTYFTFEEVAGKTGPWRASCWRAIKPIVLFC